MICCGQNFLLLKADYPRRWLYLPPLSVPGWQQMAIDHWLLEQHRLGLHPPCLRFYTWSPPSISLGYHQRDWPDHWHDLSWQGQSLELVRRPTGGRAVLHQGDLTYALILSGLEGQRSQAYTYLCEFLRQGMAAFGLSLGYGQSRRGYIHQPSCFATATGADLVLANGHKLIGSAQVWRQGAVLQHGSIRLQPDPILEAMVFTSDAPITPMPTLDLALPTPEVLIPSLLQAAEQWFEVELFIQPLSGAEWQQILAMADQFVVTSGGRGGASRSTA